MTDADDTAANLPLRRLDGMRKENVAILEQQAPLFEQVARLRTSLNTFAETIRDEFRTLRLDLNIVKSDILHLENQNMTRHGEILNLMRRTEDIDRR